MDNSGPIHAGGAPGSYDKPGYPLPAAPGEPQSLGQFFSLIVKQALKTLPLQLMLGGAIFAGVWVLHTYLVVWPNGGFNLNSGSLSGWFLGQILALRGRLASGSAFWFVFSALGGAVVSGLIRRKGAFFSGLAQAPSRIARGFAGGNAAIATVVSGMGLGIIVPAYLGNRLFAIVVVGLAFLALSEGPAGLSALVVRCAYNDGRKLLSKPPRRLTEERNDSLVTGFMFGAGLYALLFLMPNFMLLGLGVIVLVVGIVMASQAAQAAAGTMGTLLVLLLVIGGARLAFADDGGFEEAGSTFIGWIQSPGAAIAVAMGLTPAMAAALGAIIGALGPELGAQFVAGIYSSLTGPYAPPKTPPAPVAPPMNPPDIEWTGPNGVNQVLVYNPEYGAYQNILTGGLVDPASIDAWKQNIADTKAQTDAWRDRNREIEAAGQDTMSQQMAAIDAKYQAQQAQAAADSEKWKQWFRDFWKAERDSASEDAKKAFENAESWDKWTKRAELVEKGADIGIDVLATVTGPVGKQIKMGYTLTKDVTKNISAAHAKGGSLLKGAGKGLVEAGFDYGWDKLKGTKAIQRIPGFGKYTGGKFSGESLGTIEKALSQGLSNEINGAFVKQELIRNAFRDGFKGAAQNQLQKYFVKDPIKQAVGLK